jgi:transcriptional accessory protein Tex/SPT6
MSEETPIITDEETAVETVAAEAIAAEETTVEAATDEATPAELPEAAAAVDSPTAESPSDSEDADPDVKTRPKKVVKLSRGQALTGKVKTITKFGAFIDIDLPQDGLVHISELSTERVEKVSDVISVGDEVTVWVKSLDKERNRISLTMRKPPEVSYNEIKADDVYEGQVTRIEGFGVFVDIGLEREGLVHVSELSHEYVRVPGDVVTVGDTVQVKVIKINKRRKQVNLSIKALQQAPEPEIPETSSQAQADAEEVVDEEPVSVMAAAFNILDGDAPGTPSRKRGRSKSRRRHSLDDVISRTLRTQQE